MITSCSQNANTDPTDKITESENGILPDDDNSAVEEVKPPKPKLDLPDVKFDGYDFRILNWSQADMSWIFTNIVAEEETGAEVNDAV